MEPGDEALGHPATNTGAGPVRDAAAGDERLDIPFPHQTPVLVVIVVAAPVPDVGGQAPDPRLERTGGGLGANALRQITDYMHDHLSEDVTLDELAAEVHISKYHLLRQFTKSTGLTPYRYLTELRISRAATLLLTTDRGIFHISKACGYRSPSRFAAAFRRRYGTTPSHFRQHMRPG